MFCNDLRFCNEVVMKYLCFVMILGFVMKYLDFVMKYLCFVVNLQVL
jgi:hypothetical protein